MVCGVVIAMLLVGLIIILVAVTINKLRKREESSAATPAAIEAQQNFGLQTRSNSANNTNCERHQDHHQQQQQTIFTTATYVECNNLNNHYNNNNCNNINNNNNNNSNLEQHDNQITFIRTNGVGNTNNSWVFPPKAPTPNIYNCKNNEALLAANDKNGFKGFRKQFSGRFKRLVAKKPEPTTVIPPELKPQLKTIYVY